MKKRIIAMLLAAVTCLTALAGCGGNSKQAGENNSTTVMTVDGENVPASELAAYIYYNLYYYNTYYGMKADTFADEQMFKSVKDSCAQQVLTLRAIKAMAKDKGVTLTSDQKKELKDNKKANMEYLGAQSTPFKRWVAYSVKGKDDPWTNYLHGMGYTEELFDKDSETMKLEDGLVDYYYDKGDITKKFNDTYYHAKSILISNSDKDGKPLEGDEKAQAEKKAKEVLQKLNKGEKFDNLWSKYNDDTAQKDDGYYFTDGDMVSEYQDAVKNLKAGQTTDKLVYSENYGWFIVKRLKLDEDALTDPKKCMATTDNNEVTIKEQIGDAIIEKQIKKYVDKLKVDYTDEYDKINVYNVNTYLGFVSDSLVSTGSGSAAGSAKTASSKTDKKTNK